MNEWKEFEEFFKYRYWPIVGGLYTEIVKAVGVYFVMSASLTLILTPSWFLVINLLGTILAFILVLQTIKFMDKISKE